MHHLLCLFLIMSCGKLSMPKGQDFTDSDGDQVLNKDELTPWDKNISLIMPVNEISATLEFSEGLSSLKRHSLPVNNNIQLSELSRRLLVLGEHSFPFREYFSEFSSLAVANETDITLDDQPRFPIKLLFSPLPFRPGRLYILTSSGKRLLGDWSEIGYYELNRIELQDLLHKNAQFYLSYLDQRKPYFNESQAESIKKKSYRVYRDDGKSVKTYYISKELSLHQILDIFNIKSFNLMTDVSILTSHINSEPPTWWVRQVSDQDVILVFDDLKNINRFYLSQFNKKEIKISRMNGFASKAVRIEKLSSKKALIKIRAQKTELRLMEKTVDYLRSNGPGADGSHDQCRDKFRKIIGADVLIVSKQFLLDQIHLKTYPPGHHEQILIEEKNPPNETYWEMVIPEEIEFIDLGLNNLEPKEYVATGLYWSNCKDYQKDLKTKEASLELFIDAYIEKI